MFSIVTFKMFPEMSFRYSRAHSQSETPKVHGPFVGTLKEHEIRGPFLPKTLEDYLWQQVRNIFVIMSENILNVTIGNVSVPS